MKTSTHAPKTKSAATSDHTLDGPIPGLVHHCFGCAQENRQGLHLRFRATIDITGVESEFRVPRRFEGPPGHVHGGIIATILDEAMGKVNRQKGIVALTRHMSIDYLQPVPLATRLRAVGWRVKVEGRKHFHAGEIQSLDGIVLARGQGVFVAVDPVELLRKYKQRVTAKAANR
ncbi:MAG: PaaI family thioesterase [Acidobacteriaceae bacterium]